MKKYQAIWNEHIETLLRMRGNLEGSDYYRLHDIVAELRGIAARAAENVTTGPNSEEVA